MRSAAAVPAHGSVSSARTVVFGEPGIYPLGVTATYLAGPGTQYGASGRVFARVDAGGTVQFTEQDPTVASPMRSRMATEVIPQANAAGNAAPADSCVAVSGTVTRLDRMNTQSGRAAATRVPVRNALIELREEDTVFDDSYGTMVTNADGSYSFSACDDDGWFDDELEIYVRLRAELRVNGFTVVEVEDSSWIDEVYEDDSSVIDTEGGA